MAAAVSARERERTALLAAPDRAAHLTARSGLPGPRANLELLDAAGDVLSEAEAVRFAARSPDDAPAGTAQEYLPCCGLVALGRLVCEGRLEHLTALRAAADDPRWRVRESVAIALQRWGDAAPAAMLATAEAWAAGPSLLLRRAAVAAICEPRLLRTPEMAAGAVRVLDASTRGLLGTLRPRGEPGRVLGAALGYGWSVAVAADPAVALPAFERWVEDAAGAGDPDLRRVLRENLAKARFSRAAPDAAVALAARLEAR